MLKVAAALTLLFALLSGGSPASCGERAGKCIIDFSGCSRPCKVRCRMYYPSSAFWSWREGEWAGCYQLRVEDCLQQKRECELAKGTK